jgi:integrase
MNVSMPEGQLFKRPGSRNWWIAYCVDGAEYRQTSRSSDQQVAETFLKQKLAEKTAHKAGLIPFVGPQRMTVNELLDDLLADYRIRGLKSVTETHYHTRALRRHLGSVTAGEMTTARIRGYIATRLDEGRSNATINREIAALRRACNLAHEGGQLHKAPTFPTLAERNTRRGFFKWSDMEQVVQFLPDYLQDLARFAFLSGWRRGDITGLTWAMVDRDQRMITLPTTKNDDARLLALEGELWDIIERRYAERGLVPWVFHRYGQRIKTFYKAWKAACDAAGLPGRHFHDFRRSTVRTLTRAGVPDKVAMDMTGHRTRSVFDRYNIRVHPDYTMGGHGVRCTRT